VLADVNADAAKIAAEELGARASSVAVDVSNSDQIEGAIGAAGRNGPLRVLVHCAGRDGVTRLVGNHNAPADPAIWQSVIDVNLTGTFHALRLAAAAMAANEPLEGDRGVCVLTSSVAAFEGQVGQIAYAASKAAIAGMTICAARDLASREIRVATIAPGLFDTALVAAIRPDVRDSIAAGVPHPSRFGAPAEFAALAEHIVTNAMLNGEVLRLDGALRMAPR
jgi:NAD(P)-dependent dehydrogenase (short-subunit alcohol dehydrogenase family)